MFGKHTRLQQKSDTAIVISRNSFAQLNQPILIKSHLNGARRMQSWLFSKGFCQAPHQRLSMRFAACRPVNMQQRAGLEQVSARLHATGHRHEPQEIEIGKSCI